MSKLKLGAIVDDKPVKLTIELPAKAHRDLLTYAQVLARETGKNSVYAALEKSAFAFLPEALRI